MLIVPPSPARKSQRVLLGRKHVILAAPSVPPPTVRLKNDHSFVKGPFMEKNG